MVTIITEMIKFYVLALSIDFFRVSFVTKQTFVLSSAKFFLSVHNLSSQVHGNDANFCEKLSFRKIFFY